MTTSSGPVDVHDTPSTTDRRMRRRAVASSFLGGLVEWYDFYLYAAASALVFATLFFPDFDPLVGVIASFGTLALGWLARPLGGIIGGHYGDRIGRKTVLMVSFFGMGTASTLIGLLPTYETAGVLAPLLLILLRIIQGLSAGAEFGGGLLMTVEFAPARKRGLYGCVNQLAIFGGILLANGVFFLSSTAMSQELFLSWGWRIPFLVSIVLTALTFWIRRKLAETPVFEQERRSEPEVRNGRRWPIVELLARRPGRTLACVALVLGPGALGALINGVFVSYGSQVGFDRNPLLIISMAGAAMALVGVVSAALIGDRYGRRPVILIGTALALAMVFVVFPAFDTGVFGLAIGAVLVFMFLQPFGYSQTPILLAEAFPTHERYTGVSFSYQVATTLGGGLTPLISASLLLWAGGPPNTLWIGLYLAALCVISIAALTYLPPSGGRHATSDLNEKEAA